MSSPWVAYHDAQRARRHVRAHARIGALRALLPPGATIEAAGDHTHAVWVAGYGLRVLWSPVHGAVHGLEGQGTATVEEIARVFRWQAARERKNRSNR